MQPTSTAASLETTSGEHAPAVRSTIGGRRAAPVKLPSTAASHTALEAENLGEWRSHVNLWLVKSELKCSIPAGQARQRVALAKAERRVASAHLSPIRILVGGVRLYFVQVQQHPSPPQAQPSSTSSTPAI